jgi:hypothetical protein
VAKVLSTTSRAPWAWATSATAAMSTMARAGLVGVSAHTTAVPAGHRRSSRPGSPRAAAVHGWPLAP